MQSEDLQLLLRTLQDSQSQRETPLPVQTRQCAVNPRDVELNGPCLQPTRWIMFCANFIAFITLLQRKSQSRALQKL